MRKSNCFTNCYWCTRNDKQKFENIVQENWIRLHTILLQKAFLWVTARILRTRDTSGHRSWLEPSLQTTLTTYCANTREHNNNNNNNNNRLYRFLHICLICMFPYFRMKGPKKFYIRVLVVKI